jgi:hypothetical protein
MLMLMRLGVCVCMGVCACIGVAMRMRQGMQHLVVLTSDARCGDDAAWQGALAVAAWVGDEAMQGKTQRRRSSTRSRGGVDVIVEMAQWWRGKPKAQTLKPARKTHAFSRQPMHLCPDWRGI